MISAEEKLYWERRHHEAWLRLILPAHRAVAINRQTLYRIENSQGDSST